MRNLKSYKRQKIQKFTFISALVGAVFTLNSAMGATTVHSITTQAPKLDDRREFQFLCSSDLSVSRSPGSRYYTTDSAEIGDAGDPHAPYGWGFVDTASGRVFRDQRSILYDANQILTSPPRRFGEKLYVIPPALAKYVGQGRKFKLTVRQDRQLLELNQELTDFNCFLQKCSLIATGDDIEPNAVDFDDPVSNTASVRFTFSSDAAARLQHFAEIHQSKLLLIVFNGRILDCRFLAGMNFNSPLFVSQGLFTYVDARSLCSYIDTGQLVPQKQFGKTSSLGHTIGLKSKSTKRERSSVG